MTKQSRMIRQVLYKPFINYLRLCLDCRVATLLAMTVRKGYVQKSVLPIYKKTVRRNVFFTLAFESLLALAGINKNNEYLLVSVIFMVRQL